MSPVPSPRRHGRVAASGPPSPSSACRSSWSRWTSRCSSSPCRTSPRRSTRPPPSCCGSSTSTASCWPGCSSRWAAWPTGSGAGDCCSSVRSPSRAASVLAAYAPTRRVAHRRPGPARRRRGHAHAEHPGARPQPLRRRRGARQGRRRLVRGHGRRRRHRPGHLRRAARALLVGLGLPRQRAGHARAARSSRPFLLPESRSRSSRVDVAQLGAVAARDPPRHPRAQVDRGRRVVAGTAAVCRRRRPRGRGLRAPTVAHRAHRWST